MAPIDLCRNSADGRAVAPRDEKFGLSKLEEWVVAAFHTPPLQNLERWDPIAVVAHELSGQSQPSGLISPRT
jgi:hypothetical protein